MKIQIKTDKKIGDRALTYHTLAKEYGWTIREIDRSPAVKTSEMLIARNAYMETSPKPSRKKPKPNIRSVGRDRSR